jgi:hypothetical protein
VGYFIHKIRRNNLPIQAVLVPLGLICYIVILLPWGLCSYHLSVVAPYVLGMFFPPYSFFNRRSDITRLLSNGFIIILVLSVFVYIIIPRISKMADIKKVVIFLKDSSIRNCSNHYFFPPPFEESAYGLSIFSEIPIRYLDKGVLSAEMLVDGEDNFIIFDDQDSSVTLSGVKINKEIYRNDNWAIYKVAKASNSKNEFKVIFKENYMEKIKSFLKR